MEMNSLTKSRPKRTTFVSFGYSMGGDRYREIRDTGRNGSWAAALKWLWVFTRRTCELMSAKPITVGFLQERLRKATKRGQVKPFLLFLEELDQIEFGATDYANFMNEKNIPLPETFP